MKTIRIILTPEQKEELVACRKHSDSKTSERVLIVLLSHDGLSPNEIANQLKRHPHTIRDWLKRYQKQGIKGLSRKYSS